MQAILKQRLEILARQIGPEWETLASKLNVGVLRSARRCPTNSTYDLVLDTLTRWQKRSKPLNHLVNALRASGRPELARVVERWQKPDRQRRGCFRSRAKRYCNVLRFAEDDDDDDDENQERADENFACDEGEAEDHNDDDDDDNGDNEFDEDDRHVLADATGSYEAISCAIANLDIDDDRHLYYVGDHDDEEQLLRMLGYFEVFDS